MLFLQAKGDFVPEKHTDYIFVTTETQSNFVPILIGPILLVTGIVIWYKKKKKKATH